MKKSKGVWKKERTTGRKYSKADVHKVPPPHSRKKIWVAAYFKKGKRIKGYFRSNPYFRSKS